MPAAQPQTQPDFLPVVSLVPGEIRAWSMPEKRSCSSWNEKFYNVTEGQWKGPLSLELTPYLRSPMNAWDIPGIKEINVIGPNQGGKSLILNCCFAKGQATAPGPALWVYSDEYTGKKIFTERLHEIIAACPKLAEKLTGSPLDLTNKLIRLIDSVTHLGYPRVEATMQTFSFLYVFLDEIGMYTWDGKVMDPASQARARIRAFPYTGKIVSASTTRNEHDFAWVNLIKCQTIMVYHARCPKCGEMQVMVRAGLKWDESLESDPDRVAAENLAWYECRKCQALWQEAERRKATAAGGYLPMAWDKEKRLWQPAQSITNPRSIGFHFSAYYLPIVQLGEIAALAIKAKNDPGADIELHQSYEAIPYRNEMSERVEDELLRLCDERHPERPGAVPPETVRLVATVDVQKRGFWYEVRAWAPGPSRESWLVRYGFVEGDPWKESGWANLEAALFDSRFLNHDGTNRTIDFGLVDSGYATKEVLDWCLAHPPMLPSKGYDRMDTPFRIKKIKTHRDLSRIDINTFAYKSTLSAKLATSPANPGAWHLHTDTIDPDRPPEKGNRGQCSEYARQMCSERLDEKKGWTPLSHRPNHLWDCAVMQLVACDLIGIPTMKPPGETSRPKKRKPTKKRRSSPW